MANKLLVVESPAKAKTISKYLGKDFVVTSSVGHIRDLPKSNKKAIDIEAGFVPSYEVSKGKALEKIAHLYNVTYDDIVFIGDNYNDVEIMKLVGMPVSTGNAPEDVKKLCKMVVSGNNEHGVSEAINKIWF